jgi:hypothetical protein
MLRERIFSMRLRFDFWRFSSHGTTSTILDGVMARLSALPDASPDRLLQRETKVIRLQRLEKHGNLWFGDFLGVGTKRAAKKADVKGHIENLPFGPDEGLGEESAFLYDPATCVIVLQSNRLAATASSVIRFIEGFALGEGPLDLEPIMSPEAIDKLSHFQSITSLHVNMAAMDLGHAFGDKQHSATHLASIAEELNAPSIKLEVSVGHQWRKKELSLDSVKKFIRSLVSAKSGVELKQVAISGKTDNEDFEALDLITQRLKEVVEVEPDEGRGTSYRLRWASMSDAFYKHQEFLRNITSR